MEQINKETARHIFSIIGFGLSLLIILSYAVRILFLHFDRFLSDRAALKIVFFYACLYGIGFLLYWLVVRKLPVSSGENRTFSFKTLFQCFCITYAVSIISNVIGTMIGLLFGNQTTISDSMLNLVNNSKLLSFFIMVIVAPFVEELIFRKIIIDRTRRFGEKQAILFSAFCFGLFHMNLQQFIYATAIGLVFGYLYAKSGKIHYTMIMHSIINLISFFVSLLTLPLAEPMNQLQNLSEISTNEIRSITTELLPNIMILLLVFLAILGFVIAGIVFFVLNVKKITFCNAEGQKAATGAQMFLNAGFVIFAALCIASIVAAFLGLL